MPLRAVQAIDLSQKCCVSQVILRRSFTRCVSEWEICFLHTVYASRLKMEDEYQRTSEAKYIYVTPRHILVFIFRLMIWKISLLFWIYFLWPILLIHTCLNLGFIQCVFEIQASKSPGKEVMTPFQRKEEGAWHFLLKVYGTRQKFTLVSNCYSYKRFLIPTFLLEETLSAQN